MAITRSEANNLEPKGMQRSCPSLSERGSPSHGHFPEADTASSLTTLPSALTKGLRDQIYLQAREKSRNAQGRSTCIPDVPGDYLRSTTRSVIGENCVWSWRSRHMPGETPVAFASEALKRMCRQSETKIEISRCQRISGESPLPLGPFLGAIPHEHHPR